MKEKQVDATKLEFLVKLNDNIVVQRFFNVKNFNEQCRYSLEINDGLKWVCEILQHQLWIKTGDYMTENMEMIINDPTVMNTSKTDGPEWFTVAIKLGEQTICHRIFDGKMFPPKVRYTVDVRPYLKEVLRGLTDIFSRNKLSYKYLDYQLA